MERPQASWLRQVESHPRNKDMTSWRLSGRWPAEVIPSEGGRGDALFLPMPGDLI